MTKGQESIAYFKFRFTSSVAIPLAIFQAGWKSTLLNINTGINRLEPAC
jgi:hypothetical protein